MLNNKYSKVLTIILVILIIAIVSILIFVGIDWYKAYMTDADAEDFQDQFNDYLNGVSNNTQTPSNTEVVDPIIDPNSIVENTPSNTQTGEENNSNNNSNGLTYKGFNVVGRIEIPETDVDYPLLEKVTPASIQVAIGVMYGPGPNQVGNTVLVGHNFRNGTFFSNNKRLENGDKIYITDMQGNRVTYVIYQKYTTDPNDFEYATRDTNGKREITLSTCTDDTSGRLIIWAAEE